MSGVEDRLARVALSRAVEPGDPRSAALVRQLGAAGALDELRRCAKRGEGDIAPRNLTLAPEQDLEQAAELGIRFVVPGDAEWPTALDDLANAMQVQGLGGVPVGLWVRGERELSAAGAAVAVVGSRSATSYGLDQASRLAADLALAGRAVVSGAAFGIDKAAHLGALAVDGHTVGVLAGGLDRPYPAGNADLLARIAERGTLVSEVPHGMGPTRVRFLARNRIIAALSGGTVVVEAAIRSGALNTANWAEQLSRQVMGVPGPVTSASSQGVHELLRRGAVLVSRSDHVLELVGPAGQAMAADPRAPERPADRLDVRARHLLEAAPLDEPQPLAQVAEQAAMQLRHAALGLERLAGQGLVVEGPVGHWRRVEA
ncbi:MAG: DNA-processing protein DprA [Nocardioides sp.]|uniref:DNA-processing protein DprA n=1 Tax=Nocardioides sp. TaxID=35761 RepID=UPI003F0B2FA2